MAPSCLAAGVQAFYERRREMLLGTCQGRRTSD